MNIWYNGLVRQIINCPPDIMIEKWIFDQFPALKDLQLKSLNRQLAEAAVGLSESVRSVTPDLILIASNAMNYAYFYLIGQHIGHDFMQQYAETPYVDKGKELATLTEKEYIDTHQGDNMMINRWAAFLNISDWFKWHGFEDIPENYEL